MNMHNGRISGTDDVFVFQNGQLSFEMPYCMDGVLWACEYKTRANVFVLYSSQSDAYVISTHGR